MSFYQKKYLSINFLLIDDDKGLGYVRSQLAQYSILNRFKYTLYADDNSYFNSDSLSQCIKILDTQLYIHWLGAYNSYYKLMHIMHKSSNYEKDIYPAKVANCVYILRNSTLKKINWDTTLTYQEDNDLNLRFKKYFYPKHPIWVYKRFTFSKKRFMKGGATFLKHPKNLEKIVRYLNDKWGIQVIKFQPYSQDTSIRWKKFDTYLNSYFKRKERTLK